MEKCNALNIPIAIISEKSSLKMNSLELVELNSNVDFFEVYDSSLQLTNSKIEKCITPDAMITSDHSSITLNANTIIRCKL